MMSLLVLTRKGYSALAWCWSTPSLAAIFFLLLTFQALWATAGNVRMSPVIQGDLSTSRGRAKAAQLHISLSVPEKKMQLGELERCGSSREGQSKQGFPWNRGLCSCLYELRPLVYLVQYSPILETAALQTQAKDFSKPRPNQEPFLLLYQDVSCTQIIKVFKDHSFKMWPFLFLVVNK